MRRVIVATLLFSAFSGAARADFLPLDPRAIPQGDSASRDTPVIELAYGPTIQATFGSELALYIRRWSGFDSRLSVYVLAAYEAETSTWPPPAFLRTRVGITQSFAFNPARLGGTMELSVGTGWAWATTLGAEPPLAAPGDIPFGGGGVFMDFDAAWRRDFGPWQLTVRLDERADLPAFALMFDQRMGADVVGDAIDDALINEPSVDVTLRWRRWASWNPLISVHGDALFPLDQSARIGYFARAILGVAIRGQAGELIPFLSADIGNGQGMLINQHEIRFSAGVRYAAF